MYFDRFDICAAWNLWLQANWEGQDCPLYARWCRLRKYYTPSPEEEFFDGLSENAREIFEALEAREETQP